MRGVLNTDITHRRRRRCARRAQGAKLMAVGTAEQPIIFTAAEDDLADPGDLTEEDRGLWAGVILLGSAPTNQPTTNNQIEGIDPTSESAQYGGQPGRQQRSPALRLDPPLGLLDLGRRAATRSRVSRSAASAAAPRSSTSRSSPPTTTASRSSAARSTSSTPRSRFRPTTASTPTRAGRDAVSSGSASRTTTRPDAAPSRTARRRRHQRAAVLEGVISNATYIGSGVTRRLRATTATRR